MYWVYHNVIKRCVHNFVRSPNKNLLNSSQLPLMTWICLNLFIFKKNLYSCLLNLSESFEFRCLQYIHSFIYIYIYIYFFDMIKLRLSCQK